MTSLPKVEKTISWAGFGREVTDESVNGLKEMEKQLSDDNSA